MINHSVFSLISILKNTSIILILFNVSFILFYTYFVYHLKLLK